jgi:hypothetical protein
MLQIIKKSAKYFFTLSLISASGFLFNIVAQDDQKSRGEIISEDFLGSTAEIVRKRPAAATGKVSASVNSRPAKSKKYLKRRQSPRPALSLKLKTGNPNKVTAKVNIGWEEVGFTVWKLRKKLPNEETATLSVVEKGLKVEYVPERMESNETLKLGDKVRLTVESPRNGFLYVVDFEQYTDGTFGAPTLIFPTQRTRGGNNRVSAGVLIDIPAQDDDVPFFVINSKNPLYAGELLNVIISEKAINGIATPPRAVTLESRQIGEWVEEWGLEAEVFEQDGGKGAAWSNAEKEAGQVGGRSLTQEDPTPQTVYKVRANKNLPILVSLPLTVNR